MVCRAYRTFWINAVGFRPCRLGLSNQVDLSDPDFAFPSWLIVKCSIALTSLPTLAFLGLTHAQAS